MSNFYDEFFNYMIEADDGSNYHFVAEDLYDAKEQFTKYHPELRIKTVYLEVFSNDLEAEDEDDGQPTEQEEWQSFDPDC